MLKIVENEAQRATIRRASIVLHDVDSVNDIADLRPQLAALIVSGKILIHFTAARVQIIPLVGRKQESVETGCPADLKVWHRLGHHLSEDSD